MGLDDLLILNETLRERERRIDLARAMNLTQKPTASVRASLERLVELGLIEARGEKKGRVYHFSPVVYRALGRSSAYVRTRGFEPIQGEAMVNQFVQAHGKITRAEVAELCHLSELQAFRFLKAMSELGSLKQVGNGRGTYYEGVEKTRGCRAIQTRSRASGQPWKIAALIFRIDVYVWARSYIPSIGRSGEHGYNHNGRASQIVKRNARAPRICS